jgi:PAS domain-containing protein
MPLNWEQTKALMRYCGMAEELVESTSQIRSIQSANAIDGRVVAVGEEVLRILLDADPEMAREFNAVVMEGSGMGVRAVPRAAALLGWLKGAIESETWEARLRAEAEALAEARLREERGVGFGHGNG